MYEQPNPKGLVTVRDIGLAIDVIKGFVALEIDAHSVTGGRGRGGPGAPCPLTPFPTGSSP